MESQSITSAVGGSVEVDITAIENQPGKSEITMIDDFPTQTFEELQSSFGIYQEALPKYRIGFYLDRRSFHRSEKLVSVKLNIKTDIST